MQLPTILIGLCFIAVAAHAQCVVKDQQCYVDDSRRVLNPQNVAGTQVITNEYCAWMCHEKGMAFFGTEAGIECYCGNTIRADAQKASAVQCSTICNGDPNESCGGDWRILIAPVSCTGPVPPPPPQPRMINPCRNASLPFAKMPFCDPTLPLDQRVDDAVQRLTLKEKIASLIAMTAPLPSIGLTSYNWWSESAHGDASARNDEKTPFTTNFAFPITTAMAFNRSLWQHTGAQIGLETRAVANVGNGYSTFWAPVINLAREPRWGRNIETPGEDPYLTGEYATYFVRGMQENPSERGHLQSSSCCKHYVANSMDDSTENGVHHWRDEFDAKVSMQDLVDSYMRPFQTCVEKGRVSGLMCSYNAVNGVPSCANDWLQNTIARGEWQFDGYITSDCDADDDVYSAHHYTKTPEEAVRAVLRAGTDVDCGNFVFEHAQSALDKGLITQADIDARLRNLFRVRMRLGHFDPVSPLDSIPTSVICSKHALELSFDGAAQGTTLLKNANRTLPLTPFESGTSTAVIGPNAKLAAAVAGYYGPLTACYNALTTMLDAITQFSSSSSSVSFAQGVPDVLSNDESLIPAAEQAAQEADHVVLVVGTDLTVASEGHDAASIEFSKGQQRLVQRVASAATKPVVVVILSAVPLDISWMLANPKIGAILHAGQPSVTTPGVARVLYGVKPPAGRLVQTILPASYAAQISIFDFNMRPGPSAWPRPDCTVRPVSQCPNGTNPGRTHRFYTGKPVLPFGYGLSYTTWSYTLVHTPSPAALSRLLLAAQGVLDRTKRELRTFPALAWTEQFPEHAHARTAAGVSAAAAAATSSSVVAYAVNVTNTGLTDSDHVVLGFLTPPGAGQNGVPLQNLFGFDRVFVRAGETKTVWLWPSLLDFTHVLEDGARVVLQGEYIVHFGVPESAKLEQGFVAQRFTASV